MPEHVPLSRVLFDLLPQGDAFQREDPDLMEFLEAVAKEFERIRNLPIPINLPPVPPWDEIIATRHYKAHHSHNESNYFGPIASQKKLRSGSGKACQSLSTYQRDEAFIQAIEATKPAHVKAHYFEKDTTHASH